MQKPTFVLVHGLASNARMWDGVALDLAARGYRAIAIDQRGHGRSDKPDDGYDMPGVAHDLRTLLDELDLERPVVAGQSWGANVVVELAAAYPGRTRGIVPVDGGFIDLKSRFPDWDACRERMAPPRFAGTATATFEGWIRSAHTDWPESGIQGALANVEVRADGTIAPWLTFERHIEVLHGLWEHHPAERYPSIMDPVLWIPADSGDVAWTTDKRAGIQRAYESLANSRVEWFSPAHHDVHAQHPDRVAAVMVEAVESGWMA
jgi:pimeloyl-ACP methyl ester carboxylesterase